ncbi:transposase [Fusicatenibacter saccharivorans]|uniref:Rpn family recombination-promoting nuclease/putative transposase n=1 Tax=Fusicatenibacter saccharivorans TaxID=1150298 RepID=UPI0015710A24|nr:Rpn family recombination-promoting nuclease/putative transposase [Fusicatenibacter saccharivorans]NSD65494.1 transposase [Fusicatenibacter saccharivorans]
MSKKDTVTKTFMRENTVFADAFNYLIFNGKKVIQPERLQELDTTELVQLIAKGKNNKNESVQKYRDILKAAVIMEDENADYLLLGIENQTEIHYAMPVRNMIYDALQYGNQVAAIAAQNVKEKKAPTRAEFLSGFYKADKLRPVITLVLHFGADPWDGATSLHEMMYFPLEEMRTFIQDYKIHLIDPAALKPDELEKFSTSLREVLGCIKYSKDKEKLSSFIRNNTRMTLEINAARVIQAITNITLDLSEEVEEVDMCKAIDDMMQDSREEGKAEGRTEGILFALTGLVRDGVLSIKDAAFRANMTESAFEAAMKKI